MPRTTGFRNYSDVHYTDPRIAERIVAHFAPAGSCLEPFRGDGAFYRHLPKESRWCEIVEGRDFFLEKQPVDWIITNPPFSNLTAVFVHAFSLAENCVFLIPISKYWSSSPRIEAAEKYGGLKEVLVLGSGRSIGFDIGFPFAAMHFQRDYQGPIHLSRLQEAVGRPEELQPAPGDLQR